MALATWVAGVDLAKATDLLDDRYGLGEALGGMIPLSATGRVYRRHQIHFQRSCDCSADETVLSARSPRGRGPRAPVVYGGA